MAHLVQRAPLAGGLEAGFGGFLPLPSRAPVSFVRFYRSASGDGSIHLARARRFRVCVDLVGYIASQPIS